MEATDWASRCGSSTAVQRSTAPSAVPWTCTRAGTPTGCMAAARRAPRRSRAACRAWRSAARRRTARGCSAAPRAAGRAAAYAHAHHSLSQRAKDPLGAASFHLLMVGAAACMGMARTVQSTERRGRRRLSYHIIYAWRWAGLHACRWQAAAPCRPCSTRAAGHACTPAGAGAASW